MTNCASLLRPGVGIVLVDLVTVGWFNLYAGLLDWIGQTNPTLEEPPLPAYAASLRFHKLKQSTRLQTWPAPLVIDQPFLTLPLWLSPNRSVRLDLEASYEQLMRSPPSRHSRVFRNLAPLLSLNRKPACVANRQSHNA